MLNRFPLMRGSFWTTGKNPTSIGLMVFRRRSSIEQKTVSRSPRSTVGTVTEIYDYMRLLFSSIGQPHCHKVWRSDHQAKRRADSSERSRSHRRRTRDDTRADRARSQGEFKKELEKLAKDRFPARSRRWRVLRSTKRSAGQAPNHTIEAVVDGY